MCTCRKRAACFRCVASETDALVAACPSKLGHAARQNAKIARTLGKRLAM